MQQSSGLSFALLFLVVAGVMVVAVIVGVVWLWRRSQQPRSRRSGGSALLAVLMCGIVFLMVAGSFVGVRTSTQHYPPQLIEQRHVSNSMSPQGPSKSTDNESSPPAPSPLPPWTQIEEQPLNASASLLVRKSRACATVEEARSEALSFAKAAMSVRLSGRFPKMANWNIPAPLFEVQAVRTWYTHQSVKNFGTFDAPMYEVYVQFEDSPHVREVIHGEWQRMTVDDRTKELGWIFGSTVLGLGVVSVLLRMVSRWRSGISAPSEVA